MRDGCSPVRQESESGIQGRMVDCSNTKLKHLQKSNATNQSEVLDDLNLAFLGDRDDA